MAKPAKPSPDYPLTVNPCGYYSKKVRGKVHYFGRWDEGPDVALERWNEQKEALLAGRTPNADTPATEGTIRNLLNQFTNYKRRRWDNGDITGQTFHDCKATAEFIAAAH